MRKVVAYLLSSVDGVVGEPDTFVFRFGPDMYDFLGALLAEQDAVLLGRATYEDWAAYWPTATDEPFATFINTTPKHVASTTLREPLAWRHSTLLGPDVLAAVAELKAQAGRDIGVHGSITLVRSLLEADLLDELRLAVFPALAGSGQRLLGGATETRELELVSAERRDGEVLTLAYRPVRSGPGTPRS